MKRTIFNAALVLSFVGTVLPAIIKPNTSSAVVPLISVQDTEVNNTLVSPVEFAYQKLPHNAALKVTQTALVSTIYPSTAVVVEEDQLMLD